MSLIMHPVDLDLFASPKYLAGVCVAFLHLITTVATYGCVEKCGPFGRTVYPQAQQDRCLVAMPDNPTYAGGKVMPCEMEIQSNCSSYCQLEVAFQKFDLPHCPYNLTYEEGRCNRVERCEYIVIKETGTHEDGSAAEEIHLIHGRRTGDTYVSTTNRLFLQFCYRSETFSARNIQLQYRTLPPVSEAASDIGPPAVWVLGSLVIIFISLIIIIARCPWLRPCLDPPQQKQRLDF